MLRANDALERTRGPRAVALAVGLLIALGGGARAEESDAPVDPPTAEDADALQVFVDSPKPGETVTNKVHLAPIRGRAQAVGEASPDFDVILTIDVSESTRFPSGIDVDGDGEIGFNPNDELVPIGKYAEDVVCTDPDDTILAAEIHAAGLLLDALKDGPTRVGVVAFSGEVDRNTGRRASATQEDAWVEVPLTDEFDRVRAALSSMLARGPHGATNFAAAIRLAVRELAALPGAVSGARPEARRLALFLTDGQPSFPYGNGAVMDPEDIEAAISAARLAHKAGVTVHSYALGRQALAKPVAVIEMARITVGTYTPVRNPGDIVAFLQGVSFANVDDILVSNLTLRELSYDVTVSPDGSFSGFVPVQVGPNEIQVTALGSDGSEASLQLAFQFEESELGERELARELERIQKRNKELLLLLERERIKRFRDRQREVLIEAADEDEE